MQGKEKGAIDLHAEKKTKRKRIVDEIREKGRRRHDHIGPLSHYIESFRFYIELDGLSREQKIFYCV